MADAMDAPPPASDTRERILEAARRRFAAHGRDGVTMREIANDTGLTMPTLYHHFGDKRGLHDACVARVLGDAARSLRQAVDGARTRPARAKAFASALCALLLHDDVLPALLLREALDGSPRLADLVPAELLDAVDKALAPESLPGDGPMTPARRLLAFACGVAIACRIDGSVTTAPTAAALARLLLAACRQTGEPGG